jgi:hypothetical protein
MRINTNTIPNECQLGFVTLRTVFTLLFALPWDAAMGSKPIGNLGIELRLDWFSLKA